MKKTIWISLLMGLISIKMTAQTSCSDPNVCWAFVTTSDNHIIIIDTTAHPMVNGSPLPVGSYIGVFFDSAGSLKSAGFVQWMGSGTTLAAFGNDGSNPPVGFTGGQLFHYKLLLPSNIVVDSVVATYAPPDGFLISDTSNYINDGISSLATLDGYYFQCTPVLTFNSINACYGSGVYVGGMFHNTTGIYNDTLIATSGCDSIVVTNLFVLDEIVTPITITICDNDSVFLMGQWENSPGVYNDTFIAANGCDSIRETTLVVDPTFFTSQPATICAGDSFFAGNAWQSSSGSYYDTLSTVSGCDSIIETQLTVSAAPDTSVMVSTDTLTALATNMTYQWINCNGNVPVTGAVNQTFVATTAGSYAVVINNNGCVDTSACYLILPVGIEHNMLKNLKVYPNPAVDVLMLEGLGNDGTLALTVTDIAGHIVLRQELNTTIARSLDISTLNNGMYMLMVQMADGQEGYFKFVKTGSR